MKIKVSEATNTQLDQLVAKIERTLGVRPGTCRGCKYHEERAITDSSEHICHMNFMSWTGGGYVDDTPFGDAISVDYGVHQNCPIDTNTAPHYTTDWSQGGPIVDREKISIRQWANVPIVHAYMPDGEWSSDDSSSLIAAMRCLVTSKLGDEVEVPEEPA